MVVRGRLDVDRARLSVEKRLKCEYSMSRATSRATFSGGEGCWLGWYVVGVGCLILNPFDLAQRRLEFRMTVFVVGWILFVKGKGERALSLSFY